MHDHASAERHKIATEQIDRWLATLSHEQLHDLALELEEAVQDLKRKEAAEINKSGPTRQLAYLLTCYDGHLDHLIADLGLPGLWSSCGGAHVRDLAQLRSRWRSRRRSREPRIHGTDTSPVQQNFGIRVNSPLIGGSLMQM